MQTCRLQYFKQFFYHKEYILLDRSKVNVGCMLEMQPVYTLSVYISPAIPQTAAGQNGNKADQCHRTSIVNVTIVETLMRQEVDLRCGSPDDVISGPVCHQTLLEHSACSLQGCRKILQEVLSEAISFFVSLHHDSTEDAFRTVTILC